MSVRIINGDCRAVLPTLDPESFDCIVTSPPYWCLRDYGVDGQIGLEPTLDAYVDEIASLGDELWRVLKPSGTFWLNLGNGYAGSWGNQGRKSERGTQRPINGPMMTPVHDGRYPTTGSNTGSLDKYPGLKPKDLCGVPWLVAFALQARGWWLRSAIVWHKPNPMPESVTDRPTSAYEMVFLLTKAERYFYDAEAIKEISVTDDPRRPYGSKGAWELDGRDEEKRPNGKVRAPANVGRGGFNGKTNAMPGREAFSAFTETRNARNVWIIATQPYKGSHFATMPPDLAERCIKAGCPEFVCSECGHVLDSHFKEAAVPSCPRCKANLARVGAISPGRVLDPFGGAGTTGLVADRLGRNATLIELNPSYRDMGAERVMSDAPLFADVSA